MQTDTEVSFTIPAADRALCERITDRAVRMGLCRGRDRLNALMDVVATHANGNPLRLQDLLDADDFNFTHDMVGIARHLDRETGKLGGFFSPRFSRAEGK